MHARRRVLLLLLPLLAGLLGCGPDSSTARYRFDDWAEITVRPEGRWTGTRRLPKRVLAFHSPTPEPGEVGLALPLATWWHGDGPHIEVSLKAADRAAAEDPARAWLEVQVGLDGAWVPLAPRWHVRELRYETALDEGTPEPATGAGWQAHLNPAYELRSPSWPRHFDRETWLHNALHGNARWYMLEDLISTHDLAGLPVADLVDLLGEPSSLRDDPPGTELRYVLGDSFCDQVYLCLHVRDDVVRSCSIFRL